MEPGQTQPTVALTRWAPADRRDARATVRTLARLLLDPAEHWRLDAPAGAPPRLRPLSGASANHVSLTHTRMAAAAATGARAVGVDVESADRRVNWASIAQARFSAAEQAWLEQHAPEERKTAFLALWTCKEAWLKAQGVGLTHLDKALFEPLDHRRWRVPGHGWQAETRLLDHGLILSVAWQGAGQPRWLHSRTVSRAETLELANDYRLRWSGASCENFSDPADGETSRT